MEENKLTYWLYTHFFHFFDIPHFISKDLLNKFLKHWNNFFNSRDELESLTPSEEEFQDIYDSLKSAYYNLESIETDLQDALEEVEDWQKSHNWLT